MGTRSSFASAVGCGYGRSPHPGLACAEGPQCQLAQGRPGLCLQSQHSQQWNLFLLSRAQFWTTDYIHVVTPCKVATEGRHQGGRWGESARVTPPAHPPPRPSWSSSAPGHVCKVPLGPGERSRPLRRKRRTGDADPGGARHARQESLTASQHPEPQAPAQRKPGGPDWRGRCSSRCSGRTSRAGAAPGAARVGVHGSTCCGHLVENIMVTS